MGKPELKEIISRLRTGGLRADRAYPGHRMPFIQRPAVTVALHRDEADVRVVAVTVLSPEQMGGMTCEDTALQATAILRAMGGTCVQERCQYDGKGDRFSVRILAEWKTEPQPVPFTVMVENIFHPHVVRITTEQLTDLEIRGAMGEQQPVDTILHPGKWSVTLEEAIPRDVDEASQSKIPFTLLIRRASVGELYEGCRWVREARTDTSDGLHLTRTARADTRRILHYE